MHDYELYGFSVFETLAARKGTFWRLREHWERLAATGEAFDLEAPPWPAFLNALSTHNDETANQVLRYTLVKYGGRWADAPPSTRFSMMTRPLMPNPNPAKLALAEDRLAPEDPMRCYKTGSRLLYQARFLQAREQGYDDVLFTDTRDRLLETSTANLLVLMDDKWWTPPLMDGILPGIYRDWLMERELVGEHHLSREDLTRCDALAITNTVRGIVPVARVDGKTYPIEPVLKFKEEVGPRTWRALEAYFESEE